MGGPMLADWNNTSITLIPKVKNLDAVKNMRLISLCNVDYKIIAKILSKRLKGILPEVISPTQSDFVPGRLLTNNVLLAYEVIHYMGNKIHGKESYATVKLHMSKAYDRVEWHFLEAMMVKLRFHRRFVELIMKCVRMVKFRIKINAYFMDKVLLERGLRQGDPMSPYLFLLCAKAFSSLLTKPVENNLIQGVKLCPNAPSISHLFFTDDSLILFKANKESAEQIQHILRVYKASSDQTINKDKSAVFFNNNVKAKDKDDVMRTLGILKQDLNKRYLGMPIHVG
uniref:Reverse transcriptase domain-containing protein n=1 Tax=Hordeum vulgare subsp. vulgare TaxID=112509 RepID=A0A8I6WPS9_HORVV